LDQNRLALSRWVAGALAQASHRENSSKKNLAARGDIPIVDQGSGARTEIDFNLVTRCLRKSERLHLHATDVAGASAKALSKTAKPAQKCDFNVTTNFACRFRLVK
jgi:hypothetical protein